MMIVVGRANAIDGMMTPRYVPCSPSVRSSSVSGSAATVSGNIRPAVKRV